MGPTVVFLSPSLFFLTRFSTTCEESCQNCGWHHTWWWVFFFFFSSLLAIETAHFSKSHIFWWADPLVIFTGVHLVISDGVCLYVHVMCQFKMLHEFFLGVVSYYVITESNWAIIPSYSVIKPLDLDIMYTNIFLLLPPPSGGFSNGSNKVRAFDGLSWQPVMSNNLFSKKWFCTSLQLFCFLSALLTLNYKVSCLTCCTSYRKLCKMKRPRERQHDLCLTRSEHFITPSPNTKQHPIKYIFAHYYPVPASCKTFPKMSKNRPAICFHCNHTI